MSTFSVIIGISVAVLIALTMFFTAKKSRRWIILIVAIVLGIAGSRFSEKYLYPDYIGWRFETELKKQPLFDLIAKNHPKEFAQFIQKVKEELRKKQDSSAVSMNSAQFVNAIFYQHLQHAPDDYIVLYLKATVDLYHHLNGLDPRAVVKLENGNSAIDFDLNTLWEDKNFRALLSHLLDTKRYVIEAGIKTPQAPPEEAKGEALLQGVINDLVAKYGDGIVAKVFSSTDTSVPPNVGAQVIIEFYSNILNAGKENAGMIMRHIGHIKAKAEEQGKLKEEDKKS